MNAAAIIAAIAQGIKLAVDVGPSVIKGIEDAKPFAEAIYNTLKGENVTEEDLAALEARLAALSAQLHTPMEGEED